MPCDSSYMEATGWEIEMSRVMALLKELKTGNPPSSNEWRGHGDAYCKSVSQEQGDALVAKLCRLLRDAEITRYSLEMQMWWRDHLKADAAREKQRLLEAQEEKERAAALAKLTPRERKLLGK